MKRGITDRIQKLREISVTTRPQLSLERARLMTDAYQKFEGRVSVPELRALALLHYTQNRELYIGDDELIVGEKGPAPQTAPTFPELCCHSVEDMEIMCSRELIPFDSTDEDITYQCEAIIPFWEERSIRHRILSVLPDEWKDCYANGIFTEFMEQRGPGHTVGSHMIYERGFLDWQAEIDEAINALDYINDPEANEKREQLTAMHVACDAIMVLGKRYAGFAKELAAQETDFQRKNELLLIAHNCEVVPAHRPETFYQALQMYWFVHLCVTTEVNPWDSYSPGRLDQHLLPFYQNDVNHGALDDTGALELLECLWIKFNNQPAPPKVGITLKESGTYTDFANINSGGVAPDGSDGINPISYLILDCMDEMRLLQPSSNVQISRKTPRKFLLRACEIARKGWGQPAFYNTEAIIQELLTAGKSLQDARLGGTSGCVETGAFGNEAYILTGYFNLPKILEITLHDGFDPVAQKQLGLHTGHASEFNSYGELFEAYRQQIEHFVDIKVKGSNLIESIYARSMPVPFLSVITNDCISKGMDYNTGGARYNTNYLQGVGIGTVTDSLAAIKTHVFTQQSFSMEELLDALHNNFDDYTHVYNMVKNHTPKYGNDDDAADDIMQEVFESYRSIVTGRPNTRGGEFRINMLPTTCHVYFGEVMQASPDGRFAGKPVSEGISPVQGVDTLGPTAVIQSAAKMNQLSTGGTLLNQKFTPSVVEGQQGLENMADMIRAYFDQDGHHIQFNVVDRETLLAAQEHPEDYRSLIVRVAGYSDYFRNLSKTLQDEIIARTEQSF